MSFRKQIRRASRKSFHKRYGKTGVRRHMRSFRKKGNSRTAKVQKVRVSRGGIRL